MEIKHEQRSPGWYEARCARFSSSELFKLMTTSRTKGEDFGDTALTYIKGKLHEHFTRGTSLDYQFQGNDATRWGVTFEPEARDKYREATGYDVTECGFFVSDFCEMFGGSPDGLVGEDGLIEIKCPYVQCHVDHLSYKTAEDFAVNEKEYYAQIQGNLLATGRKWGDFVSYDPRYQNPMFQLKIIRIDRDEEFIARAMDRIRKAEKVFHSLLDNIINGQFAQVKAYEKEILV